MNQPESTPAITDEEFRLIVRLEGIFMPQATRQRILAGFGDEPVKKPIRFVHYTSAESAFKIIQSKRIWMRNTTCMADYQEVQRGLEILKTFIADKAKTDEFISVLDVCSAGAANEAIALFKRHMRDIQLNTYISSLSEHNEDEDSIGRLSMWRAFGGSIGSVALVFQIPRLSEGAVALKLAFSPVAYLSKSQAYAVIDEVICNIKREADFLRSVDRKLIVNMVFLMFLATAVCLKHPGFREEHEWRAIYSPVIIPSDLMEASPEVVNGIPQRVYKIPLDEKASPKLVDLDFSRIFYKLIIGPSSYPWAMYDAFVTALSAAGCSNAAEKVIVSDIPLRI